MQALVFRIFFFSLPLIFLLNEDNPTMITWMAFAQQEGKEEEERW